MIKIMKPKYRQQAIQGIKRILKDRKPDFTKTRRAETTL